LESFWLYNNSLSPLSLEYLEKEFLCKDKSAETVGLWFLDLGDGMLVGRMAIGFGTAMVFLLF
jgi:hypothetical protein